MNMKQNDFNEQDFLYDEDFENDFYDDADSLPVEEWTEEDAWDALTDGMYGDYPGGDGLDYLSDIMGL